MLKVRRFSMKLERLIFYVYRSEHEINSHTRLKIGVYNDDFGYYNIICVNVSKGGF
jgi:chloramphenicol O-acetyltransferase